MNSINPSSSINPGATSGAAFLDYAPRDAAVLSQIECARQRIEEGMLREVEVMALFALGAGFDVPAEALAGWQPVAAELATPPNASPVGVRSEPIARLAELHLSLSKIIAPARGSTLVLLADQKRRHPFLYALGPVAQVRWMLTAAVLSLMLLLGIALSGDVNAENVSKGLLNLAGPQLAKIEMFLVAAAAVGATLANLKLLNRYISNCTYDPRYDSSYWTRLVMGLISGVILSQVVFGALVGTDSTTGGSAGNNALLGFGQPILAILGGFSADLVHDILTHLITVIGNTLGLRKQA